MVWRWQLRGRGRTVAWRWFGGCKVVLAPWRDWCAGRRGGSSTESGGGSRGWQYCAVLQQLNVSVAVVSVWPVWWWNGWGGDEVVAVAVSRFQRSAAACWWGGQVEVAQGDGNVSCNS
ncbi:hypothetical protein EDB89DRAFT_1914670 [Lactarius sanguifluus]|nr:hypothetical protein EDB89DRAFT_1914670 [Lactarius sanguifluus]